MSKIFCNNDNEVNMFNISRATWLVKVPKYISSKWEAAPSNVEVGKLKITSDSNANIQMVMNLSESVTDTLVMGNNQHPTPKVYRLDVNTIKGQLLAVVSQTSENDTESDSLELAFEGLIFQKLLCYPADANNYFKMKSKHIQDAQQAIRKTIKLNSIVQNTKITSNSVLLEKNKNKAIEKRSRNDRNAVMDMLFKAFEKQRYYRMRMLMQITNQPMCYLREILNEVAVQNMNDAPKYMWELKPEYRRNYSYEKQTRIKQ